MGEQMEKMDGGSFDQTAANIEAVKKLFPQAVREGAIDFDVLRGCLGDAVEIGKDFYQLLWNGKEEARAYSRVRSQATLRPCPEESKNWNETQNLYIEGDNLEVLKLLQGAYHNQVKMIYIDPPYNTGKDFVYHDNFHDSVQNYKIQTGQVDAAGNRTSTRNSETSGRYHTDWLNMIFPRLLVARNLLRDDGVIFISIDDNEITNLRKVADDVFGEDNFIGQITVLSNPRGRDYGGIAKVHEYVVAYGKTDDVDLSLITDPDSKFRLFDEHGGFELRELRNRNVKFNKQNRPNLYYPFYINTENKDENGLFEISLENKDGWQELYPLPSQGVDVVWRWGMDKSKENLNIEIAAKKKRNGGFMIVEKYRESKKMARSLWTGKDSNTERGTIEVKELFDGAKVFDYPKPVSMLRKMLEMATGDDDEFIVLDFFSGSGSMAHAVLLQNAIDSVNRHYIMVQLPELTYEIKNGVKTPLKGSKAAFDAGYESICEIGMERIRRAGEKIKKQVESKIAEKNSELNLDTEIDVDEPVSVPDIGFRVFKLDTSNIVAWNPNAEDLEQELFNAQDNILADRTREDLFYEILLKSNIMPTAKVEERTADGKTIYVVSDGKLMVALDDDLTVAVADEIVRLWREEYGSAKTQNLVPPTVVFRETGFKSDEDKANSLTTLKSAGFETIRTV